MPTLITDNDTVSNGPVLAVLNKSFQTVTESPDPLEADWLSQSDKVGFLLLLSLICFVAFFGNALVLTIAVKSSKMRTTNNCFIFNLAFCDFIVGCFSIPVMITTMLAKRWVFGPTMCNITAFVDNMVMMESIWTLATLSSFRAISVLDPFKVKQRSIRRKVLVGLLVLWFLVGAFTSAPLYGWSHYSFSPITFNCGTDFGSFFMTFIILVLFLPIFVVVISYIIILSVALSNFAGNPAQDKRRFFKLRWKRKEAIRLKKERPSRPQRPGSPAKLVITPPASPAPGAARALARNSGLMATVAIGTNGNGNIGKLEKTKSKLSLKLFKSRSAKSSIRVLIIVGVFLVCVGPILILGLVAYISEKFISLRAAFLVYILSLSHSAINPVVYGLFDIRFREAYKALFIRSPKTFYSHSQARSCTVRGGGLSETVPRPGHPALGSRQASGSNVGDQTGDDPVINCDVIH
ncbi:hypothetical protein ACHWQZ_G002537 [Mnemiopsis leidyi]